MFARVTTTQVAPEAVDEAIRLWHEITAPPTIRYYEVSSKT